MKSFISASLIVLLVMLVAPLNLCAEMATEGEALQVAKNWINLTISNVGSWGGYAAAEIKGIREFKYKGRHIGYFCEVTPKGFIIVSLLKPLAPVKAYSETCDLDPESEKGLADLIKLKMDHILTGIEKLSGPIRTMRIQDMTDILEIDYSTAWEALEKDNASFLQGLESEDPEMNYQSGGIMLSSSWHQGDPYNLLTPTGDTGCTICGFPPNTYLPTLPTLVGCVATAGAQIMKYWSWPPYGYQNPGTHDWDGDDSCGVNVGGATLGVTITDAYDWAHMANRYVWNTVPIPDRWEDENGDPLTQAHLDAVSELCYEVGIAVEMDYGVCLSGAQTYDMIDVYTDHYRYHTDCTRVDRDDFETSIGWFEHLKFQFNLNRPVQYRVLGHSMVGDGWRERWIGGTYTREYHINYGWDNNRNIFYVLDALHYPSGGTLDDEYVVENIVPNVAMGPSFGGDYLRDEDFPFRYFDQDAVSEWATFYAHNIQFLPGVTVTCEPVPPNAANRIEFVGWNAVSSLLFSRGDQSRGIRIHGGAGNTKGSLVLHERGSIKFH